MREQDAGAVARWPHPSGLAHSGVPPATATAKSGNHPAGRLRLAVLSVSSASTVPESARLRNFRRQSPKAALVPNRR